jgi:hypothetical protein
MKQYIKINHFIIVLTALCFGITFKASGQNFIDEDFLDNIEANARPMFNEPATAFQSNTTPSKWDKESAVIIGYSRSIQFDRTSREVSLRAKNAAFGS